MFYFKIKIHLAQSSSSIQNNLSVNPPDFVWYENRPLGVHKLGKMVNTISGGAKLSQIYTNHFVLASATTLLSNAKYERVDVGRKSELVFRAAFSTPVIFREMSKLYLTGLITKTDFILPFFFCTFVVLLFNAIFSSATLNSSLTAVFL